MLCPVCKTVLLDNNGEFKCLERNDGHFIKIGKVFDLHYRNTVFCFRPPFLYYNTKSLLVSSTSNKVQITSSFIDNILENQNLEQLDNFLIL